MANKIFGVVYGLSGAGKSLTISALEDYCSFDFYQPPVIKSWQCRPDSKPRPEDVKVWHNSDYFLPRDEQVRKLSTNPRYLTTEFRGHWQAFDLENVLNNNKSLAFRDLYYTFIPGLKKSKYLKGKVEIRTIFLSPFQEKEIKNGIGTDSFRKHVYSMMSQILALRSCKQKKDKVYNKTVMDDNELRAITAYQEIKASQFADIIIYNPFPEGHPAWNYDDKASLFLRKPEKEVMAVVKQVKVSLK